MVRNEKWMRAVDYAEYSNTATINVSVFMHNHRDKHYIKKNMVNADYTKRSLLFKERVYIDITNIFYDLTYETGYSISNLIRDISHEFTKSDQAIRTAINSVLQNTPELSPTNISVPPETYKLFRALHRLAIKRRKKEKDESN